MPPLAAATSSAPSVGSPTTPGPPSVSDELGIVAGGRRAEQLAATAVLGVRVLLAVGEDRVPSVA